MLFVIGGTGCRWRGGRRVEWSGRIVYGGVACGAQRASGAEWPEGPEGQWSHSPLSDRSLSGYAQTAAIEEATQASPGGHGATGCGSTRGGMATGLSFDFNHVLTVVS